MPPIESRISNESRADDEEDLRYSFRGSQNVSETRRHEVLITVYCVGAVIFLTCSLQLCRRTRHFFQLMACNAGATRRERGIEEGPRTPRKSRRLSDEGKEEIDHQRFLRKTLLKLELEQYQEAHNEWLQRLEEREKRAHEHRRDLNKKERHLLRVIRKLKGPPRVTLEDRHREQRLEDLENILEKRHLRLEVLQKEVNESLGTYLRIRAQHSEEKEDPQTRTQSRAESRASIDPDRDVATTSSHDKKRISRDSKKLSRPSTPRKTPDNSPLNQSKPGESGLRNSILRISAVSGSDPVKSEERRVSLLDNPNVPSTQHIDRKSTNIDPGTVLRSSLKATNKPSKTPTEEAEEALDIKPYIEQENDDNKISENEEKTISEKDSKPPVPRSKSEDQSKPKTEKKLDSKPSDSSKKSVDQSKSDPGRKSDPKPQVAKKSTDDTKPKLKTSSKTPTENKDSDTKGGEPSKQDTTRKSEAKPPENVRKSTARSRASTSTTAEVDTTKSDTTAKSSSKHT